MSKEPFEQREKDAAEKEQNKKKIAQQDRNLAQEEERKRAIEIEEAEKTKQPPKEKDPKMDEESTHLFDIARLKKDSDALLEDYNTQNPENKIDPASGRRVLVFTSREEVDKFLKGQAEKGRSFLLREENAEGVPNGQYHFSCGDGKFYSGTTEEIQQKLQERLNAKDTSPETKQLIEEGLTVFAKTLGITPKPNHAQEARKRLNALKLEGEQTPTPSSPEDDSQPQSHSPFNNKDTPRPS